MPKPIYRAFGFVASLGETRVDVTGAHDNVAVRVGAAAASTTLVPINQAMPRHAVAEESVAVRLRHDRGRSLDAVTIERIDDAHANPAAAWDRMGSPEYPTPAEVAALEAASRPSVETGPAVDEDGVVRIDLRLAPPSVNRVRVAWRSA